MADHVLEANVAERDYFGRLNKNGKAAYRHAVMALSGGLPSWAIGPRMKADAAQRSSRLVGSATVATLPVKVQAEIDPLVALIEAEKATTDSQPAKVSTHESEITVATDPLTVTTHGPDIKVTTDASYDTVTALPGVDPLTGTPVQPLAREEAEAVLSRIRAMQRSASTSGE